MSAVFVKDIMSKNVSTTTPDERISSVISKMEKHDLKELPVVRDGELIGIISLYRILSNSAQPTEKVLNHFESCPTVSSDAGIEEALKLMLNSGVEAIPVLDKKNYLVGIISDYDLLKAYTDFFSKFNVGDVIRKVPSISNRETVGRTEALMRRHKTDRLAVCSENQIDGMILGLDIMRKIYMRKPARDDKSPEEDFHAKLSQLSIDGFYRKKVPTLLHTMSLKDALIKLLQSNSKGLPVVKEGYDGLILRKDIFNLLRELVPEEQVELTASGDIDKLKDYNLDKMIEEKLKSIKSFVPDAQFHVNIKAVHDSKKPKYEVMLYANKPGKDFRVKEEGWRVEHTLNRGIKKLEKIIKKEYGE